MKKIYAAFLVLLAVSFSIISSSSVYAAGSDSTLLEISSSASSAVADNAKTITFTVLAYRNQCASGSTTPQPQCPDGSAITGKAGQDGKVIGIYTTSTGNSFGQTQTFPNGVPYVTTGADGKAQFTLASSVAESKTLTIWISSDGTQGGNNDATATVTFTAPVAATAPKKITPAPTTQTVETPAPEAPKVATLEVDGQAQPSDQTFSVEAAQPLVLKGTTVANGVVKLYIFSTPREASVTADASGNWSYEIANLEPGDHHVEAEVTDPATNKTSTRATLATFTVAAPVVKEAAEAAAPKANTVWYVGGAAIVLALGAGTAWWLLKKKRQQAQISQDDSKDQSTPPTPPSEGSNV